MRDLEMKKMTTRMITTGAANRNSMTNIMTISGKPMKLRNERKSKVLLVIMGLAF